jgi:hypothetical protein
VLAVRCGLRGRRSGRAPHWFGGNPHHGFPGANVTGDDSAGGDHSPVADDHVRHDGGPDPEEGTDPDMNVAGKVHPRRQMRVTADDAVMIDGRTGVDDDVIADPRVRLDDAAGEYNTAGADSDRRMNPARRVNER